VYQGDVCRAALTEADGKKKKKELKRGLGRENGYGSSGGRRKDEFGFPQLRPVASKHARGASHFPERHDLRGGKRDVWNGTPRTN